MDKYLKKTPRVKDDKDVVASTSSRGLRQSTIHSLKGVVVVEEIQRLKCKLQLPDQSPEVLVASLRELSKKIPPRHVLTSTKIGHSVNKLRKHPDPAVATEARRVYVKWKTFFVEKAEKPQIEVKCDLKTERARTKAKTLFAEALGVDSSDILVESVEREVFHSQKRLISFAYHRTMRAIVFKLKNSEETRSAILNRTMSVEQFVKEHKKS